MKPFLKYISFDILSAQTIFDAIIMVVVMIVLPFGIAHRYIYRKGEKV